MVFTGVGLWPGSTVSVTLGYVGAPVTIKALAMKNGTATGRTAQMALYWGQWKHVKFYRSVPLLLRLSTTSTCLYSNNVKQILQTFLIQEFSMPFWF